MNMANETQCAKQSKKKEKSTEIKYSREKNVLTSDETSAVEWY